MNEEEMILSVFSIKAGGGEDLKGGWLAKFAWL